MSETLTDAETGRLVKLEGRSDGIHVLTLLGSGSKPFILNEAAVGQLEHAIDQIARTAGVKGLVIESRHPTVFCAGADIELIAKLDTRSAMRAASRRGQELYSRIEDLPFPTAALIQGTCLGGGLELALACTWRIVARHPATRLGLPEVQLGILPAWGGTTRLPLLVGLRPSLPMLLQGKTVDADTASNMGLADTVVPPGELKHAAEHLFHEYYHGLEHGHPMGRKTHPIGFADYFFEKFPSLAKRFMRSVKSRVRATTHGRYPAPLAICDVLEQSLGEPRWSRLDYEREAVVELLSGKVAKRLIGLYMKNRDKFRGSPYADVDDQTPGFSRVAIVGAGVMGQGIAIVMLQAKKEVRLIDPVPAALAKGKKAIEDEISGKSGRGKKDASEAQRTLSRLTVSSDYSGLASFDLVIEAAPEKMDLKKLIFGSISAHARPDAVICSNTSSLALGEMANSLSNPARFAGLHFFNPVPKMPLVEVGCAEKTAEATIVRLIKLVRELQKTPVVVADSPAFAVNRILAPYLAEAMKMAEEGADPAEVDAAMRGFGLPMGPFELIDTVGVDVILDVSRYLASIDRLGYRVPALAERMAAARRLGRKSGSGFYSYDDPKHPHAAFFDEKAAHAKSSPDRKVALQDPEQIVRRLTQPLRLEAQRVLDENVVESKDDLDLASIYGMGFPAWSGGIASWVTEAGSTEGRS